MKMAFIPPYSLLETTERTTYQLMLPQCVEESERYEKKYFEHCQNAKQFVILDNGAAEGVEFDWSRLIDMAYHFDVNEIVIPDVIGDKDQTIIRAEAFHTLMFETHTTAHMHYEHDFHFMFVLQGQNIDEVMECAQWAADKEWITTLGIPRHLVKTIEGVSSIRSKIANAIQEEYITKDLHFLGSSPHNSQEIITLGRPSETNQAYVRSMDTSMPYNFAYYSKYVMGSHTYRPNDYFNLPAIKFSVTHLEKNLEFFERYAGQVEGKK